MSAARGHALMHRAQARYRYGSGIHGNGIIIGYCDGPEYIIRRDDHKTLISAYDLRAALATPAHPRSP